MIAKTVTCLLLLVVIAAPVAPLQAQRAGAQVAIAQQPGFSPPVQPIVTVGQQPLPGFGIGVMPPISPPIITTNYSPVYSQFQNRNQNQPRAVAVPPQQNYFVANPGYGYSYNGYNGYNNYTGYNAYNQNGLTVIVPNGTVITNSTVIIQQPPAPAIVVRTGPGAGPAPIPGFTPPVIGTPRQQVIQQYGNPISSLYTLNGEMLYFSGGATVLIQNGKVAPQRPN